MSEGVASERPPLCDEVVELLASGVVMSVGTRDRALCPECVPAMGSRVHRDRRTLTVFVPRSLVGATLTNLEDNGQIAVSFARPSDEKTMQVKGQARKVREATEADRPILELSRGGFVEQMAVVGTPRAVTRRMAWWPSVAIDIDVADVFVQTPGPGAGARLPR
jgi:hypothetical protein